MQQMNKSRIIKSTIAECEKDKNRTNRIKQKKRARTVHPKINGIIDILLRTILCEKHKEGGFIQKVKL